MTGALELTRRSFVSANSGDYQRHASIWLWDEGVARSVTHYRDVDAARKLAFETAQSKK